LLKKEKNEENFYSSCGGFAIYCRRNEWSYYSSTTAIWSYPVSGATAVPG
jgi:hypothetical protein